MRSSAQENALWLDRCVCHVPEERLPSEDSPYSFGAPVRCRMWMLFAASTRLSPALLNDFADCFATLPTPLGVEKGRRVASYVQGR